MDGRRAEDRTLNERVTVLETRQQDMANDLDEIKCTLKTVASREDVVNLRDYFDRKDDAMLKHLWWTVKAFVVLLTAIALAAFGIENLPWR